MERRLAAILAADGVGYSRLMEVDEQATVRTLNACRDIIDGLVEEHGGRVFGSAGDSVIAEFPSPVEAVHCAVGIQRRLAARNAELPEERRMGFRIGVHLGDVIVEGDNLLGDGVNIAARLESLAEPGGISLSRPVLDQVRKQPDLTFESVGRQEAKNIAEPIEVYRVVLEPGPSVGLAGTRGATMSGRTQRGRRTWKALALALAACLLLVIAGGLAWLRPWAPALEPASLERMAFPIPEQPSVAVLPFETLGGDIGQSHLADGLTEDIITALSQVSALFVIARNSSFTYKGQAATVQQVAEELGVRYVLDGSVQSSGERIRISAQLVDTLTGSSLWAERYDRDLTELFALQDEITERVVTALRVELTEGEEARVHRAHTNSLEAWNLLSRGKEYLYLARNKTENAAARQLFEQAIEVDRAYALAYAFLAWSHWQDAFQGWSEDPALSVERAAFLAAKAKALDETLPDVHALQGAIHLFRREYDAAIEAAKKAVAANPNHATNTALLAMILHNAGQPETAVQTYKKAMRLSPYYPAWFLEELGFAYLAAKEPQEALAAFATFLEREPETVHAAHAHIGRALAYHVLGRDDDARAEIATALAVDASISLAEFRKLSLAKDRAGLERGLAILRGLGLPE